MSHIQSVSELQIKNIPSKITTENKTIFKKNEKL